MRTRVLILLALASFAAAPARAFDERVWLMIGGGGSKYAMADLNDELRFYNTTNGPAAPQYALLEQGAALSIAAGFEMANGLTLGLGTDRMFASTGLANGSNSERDQFTAHAWRMFAEYPIRPFSHAGLRLGVGGGVVGESGKITFNSAGSLAGEPMLLRGWAPMFEGYGGADVWLNDRFGLTGAVGYRQAKIAILHTPPDATGHYYEFYSDQDDTPLAVDYSGAYLRVGFKYVGKRFGE